jgi:hypothetical protein
LRPHFTKDLVTKFWDVYNNNNDNKLQLLFSDPLVKLLWKIWAEENLTDILKTIPPKGQDLLRRDFIRYQIDWPLL